MERDSADVVDDVAEFIESLNTRMKRAIRIKGVITEVTLDRGHEIGIDWDKVLGSISLDIFRSSAEGFTYSTKGLLTSDVIKSYLFTLKRYGDVKVVSKPSLTVLNGAIGSLIVGNTLSYVVQPYTSNNSSDSTTSSMIVHPLQAGLSFYVFPQIIYNEETLLYISPELTTVQTPNLSLRQTQTVVNVKNGETILVDSEKGHFMIGY